MQNIREEIIKGLEKRYHKITDSALAYLNRDRWLYNHPQVSVFIDGVKKCLEFAKNKNLTVGPARGSASASISLFGLGLSAVDPLKHELIPEKLSTQSPFFHIDVEYERGQEFVDFCSEINKSLPYGEIQAFKMPLLDIIKNTHTAIGKIIDYEGINDNSDVVLNPIRTGDLEKIFQFDFSEDALVMNFERFLPEYQGPQKIKEHFRDQKIFSFRDIINITALWRPHTQEIVDRINLYRRAKNTTFSYGFLSEQLESWLKPNYGIVIYQEDLIKIISEYTGWDFSRSNELRRLCISRNKTVLRDKHPLWHEFQNIAPKAVVDLVAEESKWSFCLPHAIAFAKFTKQTAVLKSLHKEAYFKEINQFEQKHGFRWDDIGIRIKGVSLHQG